VSAKKILITGISGNLGSRVRLQLAGFSIVGVDFHPPHSVERLARFESLDLGEESSCDSLVALMREEEIHAVVHLAFVIDPLQTGVLDEHRMWQINVAGTARVMEAIAERNRHGGAIEKFVFISSVSAYGPETPGSVDEHFPLGAHTLPYAVHKREADEVVRARATQLGDCRTVILRPHIFAGSTMQNYLIGALRGTPTGKGRLAQRIRDRGERLPIVVPFGKKYLQNEFQFVHVDDVARLISFILEHPELAEKLTILNVAGRGDSLPFGDCAALAEAKIIRLPGRLACRLVLEVMWKVGISGVPPAALPYILGSYTMKTSRLQNFLGENYEQVIRFTIRDALLDSVMAPSQKSAAAG
jgi:Nucleoside-diphosphate-sugar epimerases